MSRKLWDKPPASVAEAAEQFAALGLEILPVRAGEKVPAARAWTTETFGPADIDPQGNLGIRLAPPLIDIDLDCEQAAALAELLMPPTLVSGRASAPRTHLWYSVDSPLPSKVYADEVGGTERTVLLEIRAGSAHYTLAPPSIHPSGEVLSWSGDTLTSLDAETVQKRVALVAACTLLSRHWPGRGQRHAAYGALAGMLLAHQVPADLIRTSVRGMCHVTQDDETEDRVRHVDSTVARWDTQAPTSGTTTLKTLLGEPVTRAAAWLADTWGRAPILKEHDPKIAGLNAVHFVTMLGAQMVVGMERPHATIFQTFPEFERLYFNAEKVGTQKIARLWLEHPGRRTYDSVGFSPPGAPALPDKTYNLWVGFSTPPDPRPYPERRIARYLQHLHEVIADGNNAVANYVIDLLADAVQRPGRPIGKALALRGRQGTGKSVFIENFGKLFGRQYISVSHKEQITGKFNQHLSGKIILVAEEAVWAGDKQGIGVLKRLVTQDTLAIERKGLDVVSEPNYIHLFLCTNEDWVWPAGPYERRGIVIDVNKPSTEAYFDALWAEVASRDFGPALLAYLQARAVDTARLRRGLHTAALEEQQDYTADAVQAWWRTILDDGSWPSDGAKVADDAQWPSFLALNSAYGHAADTVKRSGFGHLGTRATFTQRWMKLLPKVERCQMRVPVNVSKSGAPHYESSPTWGVRLPSLETCRRAFVEETGTTRAWLAEHAPLLPPEEDRL